MRLFFFPQVCESPPGPVQTAFYCRDRQVESLGYLHFGTILPIAHNDGSAVGGVEGLQTGLQAFAFLSFGSL
jgi:hypothetical protein